ncbi:MAG: hypothetical protein Q8L00_01825, partial [Deltaproteobacteria bacterium]|nr:hypothetical protein [Deltaproteobacteria bacterium]
MLRNNLLKVGLGILFVISLTSTANALTFSDGTFNNADWELIVQSFAEGCTSTASQQPLGGNPGEYRRVINFVTSGNSGVVGYHFYKNSEYNPSLQGEITSIDFSYDHKMFIGFGEGQSTSFAIFQGGKYFWGGPVTWADQLYW